MTYNNDVRQSRKQGTLGSILVAVAAGVAVVAVVAMAVAVEVGVNKHCAIGDCGTEGFHGGVSPCWGQNCTYSMATV